jgi:hypothetical protein
LPGCSDEGAHARIATCKMLGITDAQTLKACGKSRETQRQIIDPILAKRKKQEISAYNNKIS